MRDSRGVLEWDLKAERQVTSPQIDLVAQRALLGAFRAISPDFRYLAFVADQGSAKITDRRDADKSVIEIPSGVRDVVFSPDSTHVAFEDGGRIGQIWDLSKRAKKADVSWPSGLKFSPNHRYLRGWQSPGVVDSNTGQVVAWVPGSHPQFDADGRSLLVATENIARLVGLPVTSATAALNTPYVVLRPAKSSIAQVGNDVWLASFDKLFRWDSSANPAAVEELAMDRRPILAVAADTNTGTIFFGTDTELLVPAKPGLYRHSKSGSPNFLTPVKANFLDLQWSPSGMYLAAATIEPQFGGVGDGGLWVWRREGEQIKKAFHVLDDPLSYAVAFSPDEECLAVGGGFSTVVWKVGQDLTKETPLRGYSRSVSFTSDGQYLATSNREGVSIWERQGPNGCDYKLVKNWRLDSEAKTASFAKSGATIVVSTEDGEHRVMDALTGEQLAARKSKIDRRGNAGTSIFSQDGRFVYTIDEVGVSKWTWQLSDLLAEACSRLPQNLTPPEWAQYVGEEPYRKTCANLP